MPWRTVEDLPTGLNLLCDEHDAQYCLVAAAHKAVISELDPMVTGGLLSMLCQGAQTHALAEERLMQLYDFCEYESHARKHEQLVDAVQAILDAHQSGHRGRVAARLNAFADALNNHIGEDDAAFQRHLLHLLPDRSEY